MSFGVSMILTIASVLAIAQQLDTVIHANHNELMTIKRQGNHVELIINGTTKRFTSKQNITIFKHWTSRGFSVLTPYFDKKNVTISQEYYQYNGHQIHTYDRYHALDPKTGMVSNIVRGPEKVVISFPDNQYSYKTVEIQLQLEAWVWSKLFVGFFAGVAVAYVLFLLVKMRSVGWICSNSCRCSDDGYHLIRESDKGTLLRQYIIKAVFHNLDVYSDFAYILMVPKYSKVFSILMLASVLVPMLYLVKRNWKGCNRVTLKWWLLDFFGLYQVYFIKYMGVKDPTVLANESSELGSIYILEDGPQFLLQLTNSMLVGSNWSWIQVLSPFLSLKALSERFLAPMYGGNEKRNIGCLVANFIVFVLPTLCLVFVFFDKVDNSPPWAKLQSNIRWNVEKFKTEHHKPNIY